ncbi:acyl-homoserine-lactone synthase [Pseudomonas sp. D(2018)]|uniref:acyl-homoserine-lactone synthase n=1 Tax=Pseudomonas sp. D(2018) TaxID=2502238 RepID=UPI0010F56BAD|nr:acyl-homoserine-lactone synthase [Pseudomonas sp. D(2018)]
MEYVAGRLRELPASYQRRMGKYRYDVFVRQLGWKLQAPPEFECDQFDHDDTHYVLAECEDGTIVGCARLLPTTQPYLLSEVFPELLDGQSAPCRNDIWELSRFAAIDIRVPGNKGRQLRDDFAVDLLKGVMDYARSFGVSQLVSVSPVSVGRLLKRGGIRFELIAPPKVRDSGALAACCMTLQ